MEIGAWLRELGLAECAEAFAENGIDAAMLPELNNEDLKDLGVTRLADRKRLLKAIELLSAGKEQDEPKPSSTVAPAGEQRQVTVLFADIAGYTRLTSALGAEKIHTILNRYFEMVDAVVESYGGAIDKHIGDNVMAVFGAPVAHDDDPLRAVRAAFDIHEQMAVLQKGRSARLTSASPVAGCCQRTGGARTTYTVTGGRLARRVFGTWRRETRSLTPAPTIVDPS
jgi:class 3 adenylate cyclase